MEKEEKNNQTQEFKGRNLEDAISLAEHELDLSRSQFNYEIVAEKTTLFGIKSKEIVIRTWPKKPSSESKAAQFLQEFLSIFPLELEFTLKKRNDLLYFIFNGKDKHLLLRKDGALLLAFQHILNKISSYKVQTDCDFFRKRKEQQLKQHAQKKAQHVHETGKDEFLDPMNPYERRLVHIAVNRIPGVSTESIGNSFLKRVKIFPQTEEE
ncbi:Jag N-terminal domain-containing protein [bacterium]|nr:Jag N-terminal domain-containing protein [bacterium]